MAKPILVVSVRQIGDRPTKEDLAKARKKAEEATCGEYHILVVANYGQRNDIEFNVVKSSNETL